MFRNFEEVENTEESRCARQRGCNVGKANAFDRIDLNLTFVHGITAANFDVWTLPYSDAARDLATSYPIAEPFCEDHERRAYTNWVRQTRQGE
jgi:hypothetical protein